jgi:flagellin-like hook-associated protein FlgL
MGSFLGMTPSDPYTLAFADYAIPGEHNDITWSVMNVSGAARGEAGNGLSVRYAYASPPEETHATTAVMSGTTLVVTLGSSGSAFIEAWAQYYENPASPTWHDAIRADAIARQMAVTATAQEVIDFVSSLPAAGNPFRLEGRLSEGNSGTGVMTAAPAAVLSGGYDRPALFRVSQDGGKTWGPPQSFAASEYQGALFYNSQLGHASYTTDLPGAANDVVFTANYMGTWGDDVRVEYANPNAPNRAASVTVGPNPWNICVNLATDSAGRVVTTANDVVRMVNDHPEAGQLVTASLANYHEGGSGAVAAMDCVSLSTAEPYEVTGQTRITPLGHATAEVRFAYSPPDVKSPDLIYQAIQHGSAGNYLGIRYTVSADTSVYPDAQYQDRVTVSYEERPNGDKVDRVAVVHLATVSLPSCPDANSDRAAYDAWRALYPVYSCTSSRSVTSTAGDVLQALVDKNLSSPQSAIVWASMDFKDEGWDSTAKVGPTAGTIWLSGGDDALREEDYGIGLKFTADGTAIREGDVFKVGVGWYHGDDKDLEVNVMNGFRVDMNVTGGELLGYNGEGGNIIDTVQRLYWALTHNDSEGVERELPHLQEAIKKITTAETNVGTRLIRNQFVQNTLDDNKYAAESILSATEDADFTRLITDLKNAQLVYEAVLGATGLTTKLSLLNYI